MLKPLLIFPLLLFATIAHAQFTSGVYDGKPYDSLVLSFEPVDSLQGAILGDLDTTGTLLWDIGTTSKPYFSTGVGNDFAIMTDTSIPYPLNANDWFTVTAHYSFNTIISFRHKYETTAGHDGGIVEFSFDGGNNWQNVLDSCNADDNGIWAPGVHTDNFYGKNDTLMDGQWAFSGTSSGWIYSRLQFFVGLPVRVTAGGCYPNTDPMIRFRFVSDDTLESMDGWMIDDIKIEADDYGSNVTSIHHNNLNVYPNPSYDGLINFPALEDTNYTITITNITGSTIMTSPYKPYLDLSAQPKGLYFYKVTNGVTTYTGRLTIE